LSLPFSQRLRPMKGTRYFAPANDAALEGWIRNFRMIYRSQRSLAAPSTRATASILKRRKDRAFPIVVRKGVFTNDKVWFFFYVVSHIALYFCDQFIEYSLLRFREIYIYNIIEFFRELVLSCFYYITDYITADRYNLLFYFFYRWVLTINCVWRNMRLCGKSCNYIEINYNRGAKKVFSKKYCVWK